MRGWSPSLICPFHPFPALLSHLSFVPSSSSFPRSYTWEVPERAGPGFNDPSSVMWMYHSHADETLDTWAGLAGPMIITGRGVAVKEDGSPADVDSEKVRRRIKGEERREER